MDSLVIVGFVVVFGIGLLSVYWAVRDLKALDSSRRARGRSRERRSRLGG